MMRFFRHMPQGHEASDKTNRMTADESAADRKDLDKPQSLLQRLSWKISETCEKIRMRRLLRRARGIYYIGGSDVLPEPLDSEEERRCLAAYAAGRKRLRRGKRAQVKKMRCGFTEPTAVIGQWLRRKARQQIPTQKSFVRTRQDERQNSAARLCLMP